jgi:hypothetical protein
MLKGQWAVILHVVMVSDKAVFAESDVVAPFEPPFSPFLELFDWKDRDPHPLIEERGLLDAVYYWKSPGSCLLDPEPEEKPNVIAVGVQIILNQQQVWWLIGGV